ncbi:DUF3054 domain-containing protein [Isoptericola sp. b441]|uniref:DUF3054 domain-containing protein n=1 Tax=Actinotalea lenta TaxID=3064654 RepID=A0ABT9D6L6_9CELL|nr:MULTISPECIES: DUF3054 domain-containing protein [unclassified Isoptericola]MDO8106011.1 DUF3054 domain-containing protein [Isoptericola sp. b441]MDO8122270.1 DUF3054 domain-containing protein [Isoptericola sp. b490]
MTPTSPAGPAVRPVTDPVAVAADVAAVVLFVILGRRSHDEGSAVVGTLSVAWPFLAGAGLGWAAVLGLRARDEVSGRWTGRSLPAGAVVLAGAVVGGMLLRHLTGGGTPWSFVLVGSSFLALFLLGWRAAAAWQVRRTRPVD